jgi:hypothetical protein
MKKHLTLSLALLSLWAFSSCSTDPKTGDVELVLNPVLLDPNYPDAYPVDGDPNKVISPFKPHNVINVKGVKPGHLAKDMSTAEMGIDGKPDASTAKIFRIPMPASEQ